MFETQTLGFSPRGVALVREEPGGVAGRRSYGKCPFKCYWRWKSERGKPGRPKVDLVIGELIRRMSRENPIWGSPRIVAELQLLGHDVAKSTVEKYMVRGNSPPSQTWRTFLDNHIREIVAIYFLTVPTATFHWFFSQIPMATVCWCPW